MECVAGPSTMPDVEYPVYWHSSYDASRMDLDTPIQIRPPKPKAVKENKDKCDWSICFVPTEWTPNESSRNKPSTSSAKPPVVPDEIIRPLTGGPYIRVRPEFAVSKFGMEIKNFKIDPPAIAIGTKIKKTKPKVSPVIRVKPEFARLNFRTENCKEMEWESTLNGQISLKPQNGENKRRSGRISIKNNVRETGNDPKDLQIISGKKKSAFANSYKKQQKIEKKKKEITGNKKNGSSGLAVRSKTIHSGNNSKRAECGVCNRHYSTVSNYKQHLKTKLHQSNLKIQQVVKPTPSSGLSISRANNDSDFKPSSFQASTISPTQRERPQSHCTLCNKYFKYRSDYNYHLLSDMHQVNLVLSRYNEDCEVFQRRRVSKRQNEKSQDIQVSSMIHPKPNAHCPSIGGEVLSYNTEENRQQVENVANRKGQQDISEGRHEKLKEIPELHKQRIENKGGQGKTKALYHKCGKERKFRGKNLNNHPYVSKDQDLMYFESDDLEEFISYCRGCDIYFIAKSDYINHVQIYHKKSFLKSIVQMSPSDILLGDRFSLAYKMPETVQVVACCCNICGRKFKSESGLRGHMKCHNLYTTKKFCLKETINIEKASLNRNTINLCVNKMTIYTCNVCQDAFTNANEFKLHKDKIHNGSVDIIEGVLSGHFHE